MFTTVRLVNISFTSHNYHFVVVVAVRTLKICSEQLSSLSYSIVTLLYIRSSKLIPLITGNLYPLTNITILFSTVSNPLLSSSYEFLISDTIIFSSLFFHLGSFLDFQCLFCNNSLY